VGRAGADAESMAAGIRGKRLIFALALVVATLAMSGCGESELSREAASDAGLIDWPFFGRVPERTHFLPSEKRSLDPPLREAWSISTHALIEFPPAVADGVAYVVNKYGNARAVRLRDRKTLGQRVTHPNQSGPPTEVTAPTYHRGLVFFAFVDGNLVAVDPKSGKRVWVRNLHAHLESSPMAVGGKLYIGSDTTDVIALRASDGAILWRFNSPGAIKASPSFHDGRIFVADYQGAMFCLEASTGKPVWRTNTTRVPPFGKGGFYSSPAIAYGRVYAARDDGTVFAFDEKTGKVDWTFKTHDFVYGSPVVAQVSGTPPTVYIGSYDEHLYALDARTGKQEWRFDVGGPVPGTATLIGHTVYTSSFKTRDSIGIDVRTHRKTFQMRQAGYTPVVSDGRRIYLIGYYEVLGLEPKQR
jgi:outer membrane protein assembly factor BamB